MNSPSATDTIRPTLAALSDLPQAQFTACLAGVFEHSPWIAERVWPLRPFADAGQLHAAMLSALDDASEDEKLALIRAHPELAGREAEAGMLTAASNSEQNGAGLDRCSTQERERLRQLNAAYRERFGSTHCSPERRTGEHHAP